MTAKREALADARAKIASVKSEIKEATAKLRDADAIRARLRVQREALAKKARTGKPYVIARPGDTYKAFEHLDFAGAYMDVDLAKECGTSVKKWTEAVLAGKIGLGLHDEGTQMKARGVAQRSRYVTRDDVRKIKAARARKERAYKAYLASESALRATIKGAWTGGAPIPVEDVAALMGRYYAIRAEERQLPMPSTVDMLNSKLTQAESHLAALQGKGECNCSDCWRMLRAAEDEARAKRLARAPKYRFVCPRCDEESVSAIFDRGEDEKIVQCADCRSQWPLGRGIKGRRVGVRTPIGAVAEVA